MNAQWIRPEWPAPENVSAFITTRAGGVSRGPYGASTERGGMNIGLRSGDEVTDVMANRALLRACLPAEPHWLNQVHGAAVVDASEPSAGAADASFTNAPHVVCAVSIADCMPLLLADTSGRCVGAAHAGWRGLASGVIQATVEAMRQRLQDASAELLAYLGPAIGPRHFEVGAEVLEAMRTQLPDAERAFTVHSRDKYRADLFALGRMALRQVGVSRVHGGEHCTFSDPVRFYSFRRDGTTGRHAALIWRV
jgi:YfiH family protein